MSDTERTRNVPAGVRVVVGAAVGAVLVAGITAAALAPWPQTAREPVSVVATPPAADTTAVCAGDLLAVGRDARDASALQVVAPARVAGSGDAGTLTSSGPASISTFSAPDAVAVQTTAVTADDLTGFTASACPTPAFENWVVAGQTTTGAADLVLIANPGQTAATVDVTVYTDEGPVLAPAAAGLVVAPGTQEVVSLSGLALGVRNPVVRVTASGAPVVAALQASLTRTLEPVGVDVVDGGALPEPSQTIPGVVVPSSAATSDAPVSVRVLSPNDDTRVRVVVREVGSGAAVAENAIDLAAGIPVEAALTTLPAGTYVIQVDADAPIVAGAYTATADPWDFAWFSAAPLVDDGTPIPVGEGAPATLVVAAESAADGSEVTLVDQDGGQERRVVLDGGSAEIALSGGTVWTLRTQTPVRAGVVYAADGALAATPVLAPPSEAAPVRVYP